MHHKSEVNIIPNRHRINKFSLRFADDQIEADYGAQIITKTLLFCRIAWLSIPVLGGSFALLDTSFFGANAPAVLTIRAILIALSIPAVLITFMPRLHHLLVYSSAMFILLVGAFCSILIGFSDPTVMTPYFTGLFFAFAGIFSTAGLGFVYSALALLANLVIFELIAGFIMPVISSLFITYNFFVVGIILIYLYTSYLVEYTSRNNFSVSAQLMESISEIHQLSGLLPICASCKKIRDDKGYWNQMETYISTHSEADFSHGICPDCAHELYPDVKFEHTGETT
jgi:hypothetical protein